MEQLIFSKIKTYFFIGLLSSLSLSLLSCGGSGSGIAGIEGTGGSGGGGGTTARPITSIGSVDNLDTVTVNGLSYETGETAFIVDDQQGTQDDLLVGQVIVVDGDLDEDNVTATANEIRYLSNVIGPIASIDGVNSSFTILGQTVWIDNSTVLGEGISGFDELAHQQIIRVSGFVSSERDIQATRIDRVDVDVYQVVGIIDELDVAATTFSINDLSVSYQNASLVGDLSNAVLVKVNGIQRASDGVFLATSVEVLANSLGENEDLISVEGLVTTFISSTDFSVSDLDVVTGNNTVVENGSFDDIGLDARLQVEGQLNVDGVVVASRITIVHVGPVTFTGTFTGVDNFFTYTLESSDLDTGFWVTLSGLENGEAVLLVERLEGNNVIRECTRHGLRDLNDGVCYLQNSGQTTWQIRVRGEEGVPYELTAYFRRATFAVIEEVTPGEPLQVYQVAGDRNIYHLSTSNAPAGSFLVVLVEGTDIQNNGQLYIQGDGSSNGGGQRLFDCRIGNQVISIDGYYKYDCWLDNTGVSNWYLSLESVSNQQYTIHADFVVPTPLVFGEELSQTLAGPFDRLYTIDVTEEHTHVSASLTNVSHRSEVMLRKHVPPRFYGNDCRDRGYFEPLKNKHCVMANDGDGRWYAVVRGRAGLTYNIEANVQTQPPEEQEFIGGQAVYVEASPATIQRYRVPKGPAGTAFFFELIEHNDVNVSVHLREHSHDIIKTDRTDDINLLCSITWDARLHWQSCRAINDGEGYWYITVQNAKAANYTLLTDNQPIVELQPGEPLSEEIISDNRFYGQLYRVSVPEAAANLIIDVTDKTDAAQLSLLDDRSNRGPTFNWGNCESRWGDIRCIRDTTNANYWYLLITADGGATAGTQYTITTSFE